MIRLGVNINHVATLRQARRAVEPDPVAAAVLALLGGADGITVHPRPDGRHIRRSAVPVLARLVRSWNETGRPVEFNIEGFPSEDYIELVREKRET